MVMEAVLWGHTAQGQPPLHLFPACGQEQITWLLCATLSSCVEQVGQCYNSQGRSEMKPAARKVRTTVPGR